MAVKKGYKQTEVGLIPEDWQCVTAKSCCSKITDGTHDTPKPVADGVPFLTAIHVRDGYLDFYNCLYLPSDIHREIYKRCNPETGDVLMVNIGAGIATTAIVKSGFEFSLKNVALLKPDRMVIRGEYLDACIRFNKLAIIRSVSSGGAQPFISLSQINAIQIPLPPTLHEQEAIATALSDADAWIESLEQLIAKKRQIKQGAMQELLTGKRRLPGFSGNWETKRLGDLGVAVAGLTYSPGDVAENGTLVLRASNVQAGTLVFQDNVFVEMDLPERVFVRSGDILICVRNGSRDLIGKCAKIDLKSEAERHVFGAFMCVYRTEFHDFVFHQFQADIIKRQITEHLGATINQITNKSLNSFEIPIPSKDEQEAIATVLSDMDSDIESLEAKLAKAREIKQGMMQELLTGRIRLV